MSTVKKLLNKRLGFFAFASVLFWIKTYLSYSVEFELGVVGPMQQFILAINPIATTIVLFSIALYFEKPKRSYIALFVIYFLATFLLYANILYYREFSDFLTMNIMIGSRNISGGLFSSTVAMMGPWDIMYWIDFVLLLVVLLWKRTPFKADRRPLQKRYAVAMSVLGIAIFAGNLALAESDRPQLLLRTFDRNYIVKYLGINFFTGFDAYQTAQNNQLRASADESDLTEVVDFVEENHAAPNPEYFGIAEDRNVITIVLESYQQFMIDYHLEDENGEMHELLPFINSIYHDEATYSFDNFFHQTAQGKSSDAEVLAETSLYGLPQGSAFQTLGGTNAFHAAPNVLQEEAGYTSAAFHGNVGSFWNRTDTYQNFGYDYFFDADFYDMSNDRTLEYGLKDKLMFHDSTEYIEQLPQPFYSKFVTVTHHFPYPLDEANVDFPRAQTEDETINNFFVTAHYLDQAVEEFFQYLKDTGLYEDSIIVMYGDHYGISNMRNPHLAPLLDVDSEEWGAFDNAQIQRVPMMFHVPGVDNGEIMDTYSGQVDILPTLMHLLGIETNDYLFMGQDMFSEERDESVVLRNGRVITPEYSFIGQNIYDTETGEVLDEQLSDEELADLEVLRDDAREVLDISDSILMMDLLRFYTPEALKDVEEMDYLYRDQLDHLQSHPNRDTSLIEQLELDIDSTIELYETDAPELQEESEEDEEHSSAANNSNERDVTVLP